jgi:hypothetical protein
MNATEQLSERLRGWFAGRLPQDWFTGTPEITADREEVVIVGRLAPPTLDDGASEAERTAAESGRIRAFREETREVRIEIAAEVEQRFGRKVAWGAACGARREIFTSLSVPVMTRLRQADRLVLDTLVEAGVARSRSEALAWCVRLVGRNADTWLDELREALRHVARVRESGPEAVVADAATSEEGAGATSQEGDGAATQDDDTATQGDGADGESPGDGKVTAE